METTANKKNTNAHGGKMNIYSDLEIQMLNSIYSFNEWYCYTDRIMAKLKILSNNKGYYVTVESMDNPVLKFGQVVKTYDEFSLALKAGLKLCLGEESGTEKQ